MKVLEYSYTFYYEWTLQNPAEHFGGGPIGHGYFLVRDFLSEKSMISSDALPLELWERAQGSSMQSSSALFSGKQKKAIGC